MFGYVTVNQPEMKFREFDWYHSFYCGLCRQLRESYGWKGQLTLTYDMTFLILLLTGLYEPETIERKVRCTTHPWQKQEARQNRYTEYAADMNILMAYYQCLDDWKDDRNIPKGAMSLALKKGFEKVQKKYPQKAEVVSACMQELSKIEKENCPEIDRASGVFGKITAELFVPKADEWEADLRKMGFYLGKFIYLMDAYEDREKDAKSGSYNPFLLYLKNGGTEDGCEDCLNMMMAECCRAFEHLPILMGAEILRNILYAGVWTRFKKEPEQKG